MYLRSNAFKADCIKPSIIHRRMAARAYNKHKVYSSGCCLLNYKACTCWQTYCSFTSINKCVLSSGFNRKIQLLKMLEFTPGQSTRLSVRVEPFSARTYRQRLFRVFKLSHWIPITAAHRFKVLVRTFTTQRFVVPMAIKYLRYAKSVVSQIAYGSSYPGTKDRKQTKSFIRLVAIGALNRHTKAIYFQQHYKIIYIKVHTIRKTIILSVYKCIEFSKIIIKIPLSIYKKNRSFCKGQKNVSFSLCQYYHPI